MKSLLALVYLLGSAGALLAQTLPPDSLPGPQPSRDWDGTSMSTAPRTVIDSFTLAGLRPRTTPEALSGQPGLWTLKTRHSQGAAMWRGYTGHHNLILLDGISLQPSFTGAGPGPYLSLVDPFSLGQISLLPGQGAVIYGSDALGGSLHLHTPGLTFTDTTYQWSSRTQLHYLEGGMARRLRGEVTLRSPRAATRVGLSVQDFGDLIRAGGQALPSAYLTRSGDFKSCLRLAGQSTLTLVWQRVALTDSSDQAAWAGPLVRSRELAYVRLVGRPGRPWVQGWRLTASGQRWEENRVAVLGPDTLSRTYELVARRLSLLAELSAQPRPGWEMRSGLAYTFETLSRPPWPAGGWGAYPPASYPEAAQAGQLAAYNRHHFTWGQWSLTAGLRGQWQQLAAYDALWGDLTWTSPTWAGRLAIGRQLAAGQWLGAALHRSFRAPNVQDLGHWGRFDGGIELPATRLLAERNIGAELLYHIRQPGLWGQASLWYNWLGGRIDRVPGTYQGQPVWAGQPVFVRTNAGTARRYGVDLATEVPLHPDWRAAGSLSYTLGQMGDGPAEPLARIPPVAGRLALVYTGRTGWSGRAEFWLAGRQRRLAPAERQDPAIPAEGSPAWEVLHLYLGYSFGRLEVQASLRNVFDEAYRPHGAALEEAGRHVGLWMGVVL